MNRWRKNFPRFPHAIITSKAKSITELWLSSCFSSTCHTICRTLPHIPHCCKGYKIHPIACRDKNPVMDGYGLLDTFWTVYTYRPEPAGYTLDNARKRCPCGVSSLWALRLTAPRMRGLPPRKPPLPSAYRRREHENRRRGRPCIRKAAGTPSYRRDYPRKLQSCRAAPLTSVPDEQFPMLLPYTFPPFFCPSGEQV